MAFLQARRVLYLHPADERDVEEGNVVKSMRAACYQVNAADFECLKSWLLKELGADHLLVPGQGWTVLSSIQFDGQLPESFVLHALESSGGVDRSKEWAIAVLQPFPFPVLDTHGLRRALTHPLPLPLPVACITYQQHASALGPDFVSCSTYPAEAIALFTSAFIRLRFDGDASESMQQSGWDQAFSNLWGTLLDLAGISVVEYNRNVVDTSGATTRNSRPDLMLWILNRLYAKFEEKRLRLPEAYDDLVNKLVNLDPQFFGPVAWIIGVALAGQRMAAWAMTSGQVAESLVGPLKISSIQDKAACLRFSVNLLRVGLSLREVYSPLVYLPRPFRTLPPSNYGTSEQITRTVRFINSVAIKAIHPWSEHVNEGYTRLEFVKTAYGLNAVGLISGNVVLKKDKYTVTMATVGYQQPVSNEEELLDAVLWVLRGLESLHAAGLVHRDVRWRNIVKAGCGYVLIDLETVWEIDDGPQCERLRAWKEQTLVDGKYTVTSDLHLVGQLMLSPVSYLSPATETIRSGLLEHKFKAAREVINRVEMLRPASSPK